MSASDRTSMKGQAQTGGPGVLTGRTGDRGPEVVAA
jgi:hypothetical protein